MMTEIILKVNHNDEELEARMIAEMEDDTDIHSIGLSDIYEIVLNKDTEFTKGMKLYSDYVGLLGIGFMRKDKTMVALWFDEGLTEMWHTMEYEVKAVNRK